MTLQGAFTRFALPTANSFPNSITTGPDGNLWFTEEINQIGRITPQGVITEFPTRIFGSPADITVGEDGNLYFTLEVGNVAGRITTAGVITEFPIPTVGSRPLGIAAGSSNTIWFVESAGNKVGRLTLPPLPPVPGMDLEITVEGPRTISGRTDQFFTYTINARNIGDRTATGVVISTKLPLNLQLRDQQARSDSWVCTPPTDPNRPSPPGTPCTSSLGEVRPGEPPRTVLIRLSNHNFNERDETAFLSFQTSVLEDGLNGADRNPANNSAGYLTLHKDGCSLETRPDLYCCTLLRLACFTGLGSADHICRLPPAKTTTKAPSLNKVRSKRSERLRAIFDTIEDLVIFYRVREELFEQTSGGRRATQLYYTHTAEISQALFASANLRSLALAALEAWKPNLQALLDGTGTTLVVSQQQTQAITSFLDALKPAVTPTLRGVIEQHESAIGIPAFTGMTVQAAYQKFIDAMTTRRHPVRR